MYTVAIFLDIQKAFDSVDKDILLLKLQKYGIRGISLKLIESYLTGRKQYIILNNHKSDLLNVQKGVPQGSVLGPLLFNVFIDDLSNLNIGKCVLFADDSIFYVTDISFDACIIKVKDLIKKILLWLSNNKLEPNERKTKIMLLTPKTVSALPQICFKDTVLEWVDEFKYLGMYIDNKLNFSSHASFVNKKMASLLGVMYSISKILPRSTLITLYHGLVLPTYSYNIVLWGGIYNNQLNPIITKINKILRVILDVKLNENRIPTVSTSEMYKVLNFLKFDDVYRFSLIKFLHFILYKDKNIFLKHFAPLLPNHLYNTRNSRINLPKVRLDIEKNFTVYNLCKLINNLPENLINQQTKTKLKKNFYSITLINY